MKGIKGFNEVEVPEYKVMPAGAYVCQIVNAEDVPDSEYIKLDIDVAEGEFEGAARECYKNNGFWSLTGFVGYSNNENSNGWSPLISYKQFLRDVDKANDTDFETKAEKGFDERDLEDKFIGAVFYLEHYVKNTGDLGTRLKVKRFIDVDYARSGKGRVPEDKWTDEAKVLRDAGNALGVSKEADTMEKAMADDPFNK